MPEVAFKDNLPSSEGFRQAVAEARAATNPVDDLLLLAERLCQYEQQGRMSTASFYHACQAGSLDDELQHRTEWVATYDLFLKTKRALEATLMRAAFTRSSARRWRDAAGLCSASGGFPCRLSG
jgi:hypothetical protein